MKYIDMFLSYRCAGDVINVVTPVNNFRKEITESMAMIKQIKPLTIREPMKYNIIDLCAGNALTSVLSVFILPVTNATAVDVREVKRRWHLAKRFKYINRDIFRLGNLPINRDTIIIGVHTCTSLAVRIVDIFNKSEAKHLFLMPCCIGQTGKVPSLLSERLTKYETWCYHLYNMCEGKKNIILDKYIMSPVNCIITATKEN